MKRVFYILLPFCWLCDFFMYTAHLETYRNIKYEPYDFSTNLTPKLKAWINK